MIIVIILNLQ